MQAIGIGTATVTGICGGGYHDDAGVLQRRPRRAHVERVLGDNCTGELARRGERVSIGTVDVPLVVEQARTGTVDGRVVGKRYSALEKSEDHTNTSGDYKNSTVSREATDRAQTNGT